MEKSEIQNKASNCSNVDEMKSLLVACGAFLAKKPNDIDILLIRASLHQKLQSYGKAINDCQSILAIDPDHQLARVQKESLHSILHYNNTDIYASPNTNFDPWLD